MCGIVAQLSMSPQFELASKAIKHRGIRSTTVENLYGRLTHTRLPIVGVSPMWDQPSRIGNEFIAFVGEVLDFRDRDPSAESDVLDVVRAWRADGTKGLSDRDGFWSVVVLSERRLTGFVDYLGQKPLYYRTDVKAIASEPFALTLLDQVTPDEVYLSAVIKWGYCPEVDRTPYREIRKLRPGHCITFFPGDEDCYTTYETDPLVPRPMSPNELKGEIISAIRRRVMSADVPVAALVSGGLDSSIVYRISSLYSSNIVPYYASEDGDISGTVTKLIPDTSIIRPVKWSDTTIDEALDYMQEPIDLGSLRPQIALSKAIKERVCLTGDGADELFGGYGRAGRYDSQMSDIYNELVNWHLPRLDRVMMRNRIEIRSPFLARRVVEGAMALPKWQRTYKKILRDLFRDELGELVDVLKEPLRTKQVEVNREAETIKLVNAFRKKMEM